MNLKALEEAFHDLTGQLEAIIEESHDLDQKRKANEDFERQLRDLETKLREDNLAIGRKEKEFKEREAFLKHQEDENILLRAKLDRQKDDLQRDKEANDAKTKELEAQALDLKAKSAEMEKIKDLQRQIEEDKAVITREKAIDRERKKFLDLRTERVKKKESQLQMENEVVV